MADRKEIYVLIVDDDYVARIINKNIVESFDQCDFRIEEANSGMEAIDVINNTFQTENKLPHLIILDEAMPTMSGFDFAEAYAKIDTKKGTTIIMVTASDDPEDKEKAKTLGIQYFLTKPLTFDNLKAAITETLR